MLKLQIKQFMKFCWEFETIVELGLTYCLMTDYSPQLQLLTIRGVIAEI